MSGFSDVDRSGDVDRLVSYLEEGDELACQLEQAGIAVLYDDRSGSSAGVKFADAELIGTPSIVIVGRGLAHGMEEIRDWWTGQTREVALSEVVGSFSKNPNAPAIDKTNA